ncbi:hypothetical protein CBL_12297 [Carabus blaptoides fortunei]
MTTETKDKLEPTFSTAVNFKPKIVWPSVVVFAVLHIFTIYGLFHFVRYGTWLTFLWAQVGGYMSTQGHEDVEV